MGTRRQGRFRRHFDILAVCLLPAFSPTLSAEAESNAFLKAEHLRADDIRLSAFTFQYLQNLESGKSLRVETNAGRIRMKYRPPDGFLVGRDERVSESSTGGSIQISLPTGDWTRVRLSSGYSGGYSSYRTLWIDRYYRQLFGGFDTYEASDPWSAFGEVNLRYEFLPATGYVSAGCSYQYEETPAYWDVDLKGNLNKGETLARTWSFQGSAELLVSPRNRVRGQVWVRDRTGRPVRVSFTLEALHAFTDTVFFKALYGHTREGAAFRANWGYLHLEKELAEGHFLRLFGNLYDDNGELEDTSPSVQLAAPPVRSWEAGIGYRHQLGESFNLHLTLGYYESDFEEAGGPVFTSALYMDRTWLSAGASVQVLF